jgi:hypothetical protein
MRFPLLALRGEKGGQNTNRNRRGSGQSKPKPLPVATAVLRLNLTSVKLSGDGFIRVYAFGDALSDRWPEDKIVWSRCYSRYPEKMAELALVAEHSVGAGDKTLTIDDPALAEFIAKSADQSITLILTGSKGIEQVAMASKEHGSKPPPTLVLGLTE